MQATYEETDDGFYRLTYKNASKEALLGTIFHEIQHILMYRKNEFMAYHSLSEMNQIPSYKKFLDWAEELLPAERTADKRAKKMMKRVFPNAHFVSIYKGRRGKLIANNTVLCIARACFPKKMEEIQKLYPLW